jgi:hypothetical protein
LNGFNIRVVLRSSHKKLNPGLLANQIPGFRYKKERERERERKRERERWCKYVIVGFAERRGREFYGAELSCSRPSSRLLAAFSLREKLSLR